MAAAALAALAAETTASGQASANASAPDSTAALSTAIDAAFDVTVHVGALPPRPSPPVAASVRRARRPHGAVKDSSWVHEAKALEDSMRADENEVVMFDSEAGIYSEGLSSNFYVLLRTDSTADGGVYGSVDADDTSAGAAADIGAGWELQTAREGVLLGTVRTAALGVARALGVHVVEAAPREQDRARWRGCAVSSTSRLFLPLDELRFPDTEGGAVAAVFCGDREAMRVMRALQEGVDRVLAEQSTPLVPPTLEHHA
jgi:branched-subunit amino acid aminotransferase/4-amino-4-deoxychorismate lyase